MVTQFCFVLVVQSDLHVTQINALTEVVLKFILVKKLQFIKFPPAKPPTLQDTNNVQHHNFINFIEKVKNFIKHHMLTSFTNNKEDSFKGKTKTQKKKRYT